MVSVVSWHTLLAVSKYPSQISGATADIITTHYLAVHHRLAGDLNGSTLSVDTNIYTKYIEEYCSWLTVSVDTNIYTKYIEEYCNWLTVSVDTNIYTKYIEEYCNWLTVSVDTNIIIQKSILKKTSKD